MGDADTVQRQTVIVAVVLVTIAVLFFMGVGVGLLRSDGKGSSYGDASRRGQEGWVAGLGGLLAPFGPKVDLGRLECAGQPLTRPFRLDAGRPSCSFGIGETDGERPRQATLEVNPSSASVYVASEGEPPRGQDPDPACVPKGGALRGPLILMVEYTPRGADPFKKPCSLPVKPTARRTGSGTSQVLEVRFAVLQEGGTVTLRCEGCSNERRLDLELAR